MTLWICGGFLEFRVKVDGLDKLQKTLAAMPKATRNKALRPAMRGGMAIVRDAASQNVQAVADKGYATGLLARSLRVYSLRIYRGALRVAVMVKRGLTTPDGTRVGLYAAVLEYGKQGQAPRSWIRKAAREKSADVVWKVRGEVSKRLADVVNEAKR